MTVLRRLSPRPHQRGAAAIEFALIATIMVVLLLGLLVFWHAFQAQQTLNRAAGDGARHALALVTNTAAPCTGSNTASNRATVQATVQAIIRRQLRQSGMDDSQFAMLNPKWACPASTMPASPGIGTFSFDVEYALQPLLGGGNNWLAEPTRLRISDRIVVHFKAF